MPSQVVGVIEATEAPWGAIFGLRCRWSIEPAEEIDADFEQLQADLIEEWNQFHRLRPGAD